MQGGGGRTPLLSSYSARASVLVRKSPQNLPYWAFWSKTWSDRLRVCRWREVASLVHGVCPGVRLTRAHLAAVSPLSDGGEGTWSRPQGLGLTQPKLLRVGPHPGHTDVPSLAAWRWALKCGVHIGRWLFHTCQQML